MRTARQRSPDAGPGTGDRTGPSAEVRATARADSRTAARACLRIARLRSRPGVRHVGSPARRGGHAKAEPNSGPRITQTR